MRAKKVFAAVSAVCVSIVLATSVFAQDDLDNLLNDLEGEVKKKPAEDAKPAEVKPAEVKPADVKPAEPAPAPEVKPADEKPAEPAPAPEVKPADEKPAEPAPAPEVKPADEKPAEPAPVPEVKPADEKPAGPASEVDSLAQVPAAPAAPAEPAPAAPAPVAVAKPTPAAPVEEPAPAPTPETPAPVVAETPAPAPEAPAPAPTAEAPAPVTEAPAPAVTEAAPAKPPTEEEKLLSDIQTIEELRRDSLKMHALKELEEARAARLRRDWDVAFMKFRLANEEFKMEAQSPEFQKECAEGMAEAKYEAAKQALKESNRELAAQYAAEALTLRHPHAGALLDGLKSEQVKDTETDIADIKHRRNDPEYKKDRDLIRKRLRLSAQYMAVADLGSALEQCDLVLRSDPYNQQAIALRSRIQRKRQMIIDKEREATRNGMIADVGRAWRPVYAVDSMEFKNLDGGTMKTPIGGDPERSIEQSIEKRMKEMMLPSIAFRPPATIIDAVDFFRQASKDFDRPEIPVDQRGFNFILTLNKTLTGGGDAPAGDNNAEAAFGAAAEENVSDGAVPQIPNISASNLSLWESLDHVCKQVGFKFKVQGSVVMVMPKNMTTDELITRSYNVVESFVDRMNDASSGLKDQKAGDFGGGGGGGDNAANSNDEEAWKKYFEEMGVTWPANSRIKYIKAIGKLRVTNTADQLAILEQALNELNVTPFLIEIETRFVEVAQEDLNSLGFEWLLNSDYSFNVGGKLKKALNLKDGAWNIGNSGYLQTAGEKTVTTTEGSTYSNTSGSSASTTSESTAQYNVDGAGNYTRLADALIGPNSTTTSTGPDITRTTTGPDVSSTLTETYTWNGSAATGWSNRDVEGARYNRANGNRTGKNMGINAVNGTDYTTGMRYLSNSDNHISGKGASNNDQFMKINAFLGNADISMILHMLSQRSDTDLLSAPKVVTKSGQEATIKVVTIYRYPTDYDVTIQSTSGGSSSGYNSSGSSSGKILPMVEPQNFETQEVGVILTCTPDVSAEGQMINLQLTPKVIGEPEWRDYGMKVPLEAVMGEKSMFGQMNIQGTASELAGLMNSVSQSNNNSDEIQWFTVPMEQPFFKERSIDTHVSIYNGATIVMGGLITEERKSMEDKIPFLGDIPYIGRLFRSRSEWSNKRNLLIFVTARLVDPRGRQITLGTGDDAGTPEQPEAGVTPAPTK